MTASPAQATTEMPPAGADKCRAVRAVNRGMGTW
jgi:hypothetical protein